MNSATAVAIADDLPVQGRLGSCEIVPFPNPGMVSIYRDGVLHMRLTGCMAYRAGAERIARGAGLRS